MFAFTLVAPVALVALPLLALLVVARPGTRHEWLAVGLAGSATAVLLLAPESGLLDGLTRAWSVLVAAAFGARAAFRPTGFWPLALRACLSGAAGLAVLARVVVGSAVWSVVQWEATRRAAAAVLPVVAILPSLTPAFEPAVRVFGSAWAVWLVLETLVGLALAWQAHTLLARAPLGPPLRRRAPARSSAPRAPGAVAAPAPSAGATVNP